MNARQTSAPAATIWALRRNPAERPCRRRVPFHQATAANPRSLREVVGAAGAAPGDQHGRAVAHTWANAVRMVAVSVQVRDPVTSTRRVLAVAAGVSMVIVQS